MHGGKIPQSNVCLINKYCLTFYKHTLYYRIPPDIKKSVLCMGVKNGTEETWNRVFNLFLSTSSTSERQAALLALACSMNRTVLTKYFIL